MFTTMPFVTNNIPLRQPQQYLQYQQPQQSYYGIQLLDDLHNFFPALLYEPERFVTVTDFLMYIRDTTSTRFNLFNRASTNYRTEHNINTNRTPTLYYSYISPTSNIPVRIVPSTPVPPAARDTAPRQAARDTAARDTARETAPAQTARETARQQTQAANLLSQLFTYDQEFTREIDSLINGFTPYLNYNTGNTGNTGNRPNTPNATILGTATFTFPPSFTDPIPITATRQQINRTTRVFRCRDASGQLCSICHESLADKIVRKIRVCNHTFHKNCIDRWFRQNVTCPVCRHDIRDRVSDNLSDNETLSHETNETNVD